MELTYTTTCRPPSSTCVNSMYTRPILFTQPHIFLLLLQPNSHQDMVRGVRHRCALEQPRSLCSERGYSAGGCGNGRSATFLASWCDHCSSWQLIARMTADCCSYRGLCGAETDSLPRPPLRGVGVQHPSRKCACSRELTGGSLTRDNAEHRRSMELSYSSSRGPSLGS